MRELKFRAWDKINKAYTYVTLGDLICGACTETGDKKLSGNEQVWEQFTGLHDENGKEIYEGDIVEYVFNVREAEVSAIGEVCFFENQGVYGMKNVKYNNQELRRLCDIENERAGEVFCSAEYDYSELSNPDEITRFWPTISSIGRFFRDAPLEVLEKYEIEHRDN